MFHAAENAGAGVPDCAVKGTVEGELGVLGHLESEYRKINVNRPLYFQQDVGTRFPENMRCAAGLVRSVGASRSMYTT